MFSSHLPEPKKGISKNDWKRQFSINKETRKSKTLTYDGVTSGLSRKRSTDSISSELSTITNSNIVSDRSRDMLSTSDYAFNSTIPLKVQYPKLRHHFPRYDLKNDELLKETFDETRDMINKILSDKQHSGVSTRSIEDDVKHVKYSATNIMDDDIHDEKLISVRSYQEDPMLPPKFKLRKNRHQAQLSNTPILSDSSDVKLSKEDKKKWNIPTSISNWKNNQGLTISLERRINAARKLPDEEGSNNINKLEDLSAALESAERTAREDIQRRNEMRHEIAMEDQRKREIQLKELAELTRNERTNKLRQSKRRDDFSKFSNKRTKN